MSRGKCICPGWSGFVWLLETPDKPDLCRDVLYSRLTNRIPHFERESLWKSLWPDRNRLSAKLNLRLELIMGLGNQPDGEVGVARLWRHSCHHRSLRGVVLVQRLRAGLDDARHRADPRA